MNTQEFEEYKGGFKNCLLRNKKNSGDYLTQFAIGYIGGGANEVFTGAQIRELFEMEHEIRKGEIA